ncbi:MAG: LysR family transcriptional regulator [Deltaproteobacteria bacterium]
MKIEEMALLVRVAETGSMTVSARQLDLTPAAVSAAIRRIERALGARIFERTTRSLRPTEEGLVIIEGCRHLVELWQRTLDDARGQSAEIEGTVHLSAPADTTYQILEDLVAELCTVHARLCVVLDTSDAVQHLHREAIDMAIRYGPLQDSTLSARKLLECPHVLVAAPSYLRANGTPQRPDELVEHRCLVLQTSGAPTTWQLRNQHEVRVVTVDSPLVGNGYLVRRWALAGEGIAFKSLFDVIDDLEAGRLVQVLREYASDVSPIHAVYPSRRFQTARVRALHAAISTRFSARADRCAAWIQKRG